MTKSIIDSILPDAKFIPDLEKDRFEILKPYYDSPKKNNVAYLYPRLVKEWNIAKNQGVTTDIFTPSSHFKVWWKCSKGHEWMAPIYSRTHGGTQCPYCYRHLLLSGFNDLKTEFPELVEKYWRYDLNSKKGIFPDQVKKSSSRKEQSGSVYEGTGMWAQATISGWKTDPQSIASVRHLSAAKYGSLSRPSKAEE